jgi:hypothetical protein
MKDRKDSVKMAEGICKPAEMMMTDMLFGIRCLRMMKLGEAPIERAAKTYSCSFEREDLAPDQTGHADPIKQSEDDEDRDHAVPNWPKKPGCGVPKTSLKTTEIKMMRRYPEGINDIDDSHHDHIDLAAEEAGDGAIDAADDQNDDGGEEANNQADAVP